MSSHQAVYTNIHDVWTSRNLDALRRFLASARKGGPVGGGGGGGDREVTTVSGASLALSRSPSGQSHFPASSTIASTAEVNRRDLKGRTLLHVLASHEEEGKATEWVRALGRHPALQVNAQDAESGWTALHRALYAGNLVLAKCLVDELGCELHVKDHEGLTPLDLWNSTISGTNPADRVGAEPARTELFTWGNNRNFVLGTASDGDRALPERVTLPATRKIPSGPAAFAAANLADVEMARLHTAAITADGDVRTCGFGSGGRLGLGGGKSAATQFVLTSIKDIHGPVRAVALGQDHTIVVTESGSVYTFGMGRFGQLGYPPEPGTGKPAADKEEIQSTPRRVVHAIKKETVLGAAASRWHSAAFTADALYTWGANHGQLGYAAAGNSIQFTPRRVTATLLNTPVKQLAATDYATACLLQSFDLVLLYGDAAVKLNFPMDRFPTAMQVYRPPQIATKSQISKVSASSDTFAAVSSLGDVFAWTLDAPRSAGEGIDGATTPVQIRPQRIWSLRKKFTAVTDAAVGMDGSIILSTRSGHCFLRSRRLEASSGVKGLELRAPGGASSGKKAFKFFRVPYLQRVIKVAANPTGAFAAIRSDARLNEIPVVGPTLPESFAGLLPHLRRYGGLLPVLLDIDANVDEDEDATTDVERGLLDKDVEVASALMTIASGWDDSWTDAAAGSDLCVVASERRIPVHRIILAARSPVLAKIFARESEVEGLDYRDETDQATSAALHVDGCSHYAALLLLHYIYTDDLPSVWDLRVAVRMKELHPDVNVSMRELKDELVRWAEVLELPELRRALTLHGKRSPKPTLTGDLGVQLVSTLALAPNDIKEAWTADLVLELADREVCCHSTVLRARCPFFDMMYEQEAWTVNRRQGEAGAPQGVVRMDAKHLRWPVAQLILRHIYTDGGAEMFDAIEMPTGDAFIEFVVEVLAAANELLLDKMKFVCSVVLRRFVNMQNVVSILSDADFYGAHALGDACMDYITCSLETMMESHMLRDVPTPLLKALSNYAKERQKARSPTSRSADRIAALLLHHADYLSELDLPQAVIGAQPRRWKAFHRSPGPSPAAAGILSPTDPRLGEPVKSPPLTPGLDATMSPKLLAVPSPSPSPALLPVPEDDGPFVMDDLEEALPPPALPLLGQRAGPWATTSKVAHLDLRATLVASASQRRPSAQGPSSADRRDVFGSSSRIISGRRRASQPTEPVLTSVSPPRSAGWQPSTPLTWRAAESARVSLADIQNEQASQTPTRPAPTPSQRTQADSWRPPVASGSVGKSAVSLLTRGVPRPSSATPPHVQADPASAVGISAITPTRMQGSATRSRQSHGPQDAPWANYSSTSSTSFYSPPPSATFEQSGTSPSSLSFATIQNQQQDEGLAIRNRLGERPSFAQIQEEEHRLERERKDEQSFLKWFEEESSRVGRESDAAGTRGGRGGGGGRGKRGGARGGGSDATPSRRSKKGSAGPPDSASMPAESFIDGPRSPAPGGPDASQATPSKAQGARRGRGKRRDVDPSLPPPGGTNALSGSQAAQSTLATLSTAAPVFVPKAGR